MRRDSADAEIPRRDYFERGRAIARAVDHARRADEAEREAEVPIELDDPVGSLVREYDRTIMMREPSREPHLVVPAETLLRILSKLDVVRRVGVYEIGGREFERGKIAGAE